MICIFYLFVLAAWIPLCWNGDTYSVHHTHAFVSCLLGSALGWILEQKSPSCQGEGPFCLSLQLLSTFFQAPVLPVSLWSVPPRRDGVQAGWRNSCKECRGSHARKYNLRYVAMNSLYSFLDRQCFQLERVSAAQCQHSSADTTESDGQGGRCTARGLPHTSCSRWMTRGQDCGSPHCCGQAASKPNYLCL